MPSHHPRTSLARSTLIKMGARVAATILLATLISYLHILHTLREESLVQLAQHVSERSQREQTLFLLAEDNLVVLRTALEQRLQELQQEDPGPRFNSLFAQLPDGTIRDRSKRAEDKGSLCLFVPRGVPINDELRRRLLASHDVLTHYGPAFHTRFQDTFIALPEGAIVLYWPEDHTYCKQAKPDDSLATQEFFLPTLPENNPQRQITWTGVYKEPIDGTWLVTVSIPLDMDNRHVATISHDIYINEMEARTINNHLPGAYNIIVRDDGQLIVHPKLQMKLGMSAYNILNDPRQPEMIFEENATGQAAHLRAIFEQVKSRKPGQNVMEVPDYDEYLAVAQLEGPDWNFVTVLPGRVVSSVAFRVARYVLVFGLVSLLIELAIMAWVLQRQIARPLQAFTSATDQVTAGDFQVALGYSRNDELGRLAFGFELMAQEVQRREKALRQANEGLEIRVRERTHELQEKNLELESALAQLKEAQELLVQKEKLASLGVLMAGIAHEIKNPLNFVNNFAQVSIEIVEELREKLKVQVDSPLRRVDKLLEWLEQNIRKIEEHGRRADGIVLNMQLHSRLGERMPTDLNALLEAHLELALGEMTSIHPNLEVVLLNNLDPAVGMVDLVSQDFGRAILNILNNSLYAVAEKKKSAGKEFTPEVTVSSKSMGTQAEIRIRDNGTGIPRKLQDKIFNPFFTTKPAGSGVGLGLSITYDIVVRQHHGELRIESTEGHFTEILIILPQPGVRA